MKRIFLFLAGATLLTGCLKTRAELEAENSANTQQRQTVAQQRAAAQERPAAPERPLPAANRFDEYDEQMRALTGRVDSLENYVQQLNAAKQSEAEGGASEKQNTNLKFQAYEEELRKLEAQVATLKEEVTRLKAPPPEAAAPSAPGKTPYDQGESLFQAKKWKEAIVNYQKYRDQNPKGKMYADATYKIGVCFQELGMKDEAKTFLEDVTVKFPSSKEAKKAAFRLKSIK